MILDRGRLRGGGSPARHLLRQIVGIGIVCAAAAFVSAPVYGADLEELNQRILTSRAVIEAMMASPDSGVPKDLLQRARAVAIFPGVVKAGVVVAVSFGSGVALRRNEKTAQWSKPAFFTIRGGSVGLQLGAESVDLILLIMREKGVQGLLEEKFTLGADVSVAAGPVGRDASAGTNLGFSSGILSYSRTKGIFAGISLKGAALRPDADANAVYHGPGISAQDVFYEDQGSLSDAARALIKTLDNAVTP